MDNTPIAQIAASTIKGTEKRNVYPKTIDKAVLTTDKEGNEVTLDNVLIKGIDINGETVTPDENGVVDISAAIIESIDTEESQEDGGNNVVTITMTNEDEYTFNIKNGTKGSDGAQGKSAYQSYYDTTQDDPKMTEAEWVASLKGEDGDPGAAGPQGPAGPKGDQGNSGYSGAAGELEVVNSYEGGDTSALSAEKGKELNGRLVPVEDALDISSSSAEVTERIPYGQTGGYITTFSPPTKQYNTVYSFTDPIFLKAGESLTIKGCTPSSVMRIASWNPDTEALGRILVGTSAGNGAQYIYENTYTATEDIYVIISWHWASGELELTKTYTKVTTTSRIDDIDVLNDALDVTTETEQFSETLSPQITNGQYYAAASPCDLRSNGDFSTTEEILVKAGETLQVVVHSVAPSVSALCKRDGSKFRNIATADNTATQTITYTPLLDTYCVVSFFTSKGCTITKSGTRTTSDSERIKDLEEAIVPITPLVTSLQSDVEDLNDAIFLDETDNCTEGIVSGKFISAAGAIGSNDSFFYKEFSVIAGTVITFTANGHNNVAPISKKIRTGTYQVLATPANGRHTNTYTATENCTIALSGYGGSNNSRTATFYLQRVGSNYQNIQNLIATINALSLKLKVPDYGVLFDKVAVIGDSLTVGTLDSVTGDDAHAAGGSFGCSWLTCLAKKWGSTIRMHYGVGGSTCYSWLGSNSYGLGLMLKDSVVYDAYFIAYGHNDTGKYTIGTTSDTPTEVIVDENNDVTVETAAADTTFLGNYKKIVNEIRTKAPNALIFMLCTDAKDSSSSGSIGYMNQYIKELAEWYYAQGDHRVFYVDYINSYVRKSGDNTGGHWSTFGYVNIALAINDALNEVIEQYMNTNALKAWGNYLESYRTTSNDQTRSGGYLPHL